jgi:hypothetical protein
LNIARCAAKRPRDFGNVWLRQHGAEHGRVLEQRHVHAARRCSGERGSQHADRRGDAPRHRVACRNSTRVGERGQSGDSRVAAQRDLGRAREVAQPQIRAVRCGQHEGGFERDFTASRRISSSVRQASSVEKHAGRVARNGVSVKASITKNGIARLMLFTKPACARRAARSVLPCG